MTSCVPLVTRCVWNPTTCKGANNFVPGTTPCTLTTGASRRARLVAGGTFFRSIQPGVSANNITVKSEWLDGSGTPTTNEELVQTVRLTVSDGNVTEVFTEAQITADSPGVWTINAIPGLRADVNTNSTLITMPEDDAIESWTASTDDSNHLDFFAETNLSGGQVGPSSAGGIRTGPSFDLVLINDTETPNGPIADKLNEATDEQRDITGEMGFFNGLDFSGSFAIDFVCVEDTVQYQNLISGSPPLSPREAIEAFDCSQPIEILTGSPPTPTPFELPADPTPCAQDADPF